jgi:transposase InsO family protein
MAEMLSIKEAAQRLGCTERRVQQLVIQNKFAGVIKVQNEWQIPADSHPKLLAISSDSSLADELKDIAAPKQIEALRRLGIIQSFQKFTASYPGNKMDAEAAFAQQINIAWRTLRRWVHDYRIVGIQGLIDKRGHRTVSETISPEAFEYFKSLYLTKQKRNVRDCWQTICFINTNEKRGWKIPTLNSMYRFVDKAIPFPVQILLREGQAAYDAKCGSYIITDPDSILPGQIWVGDHAEFNCWIRYRNEWVRPWVTAWMDMRSRMLVGYHISTSPNQTTILLAAKNGVEKYGLPDSVKIDNGRDYDSQMWTGITKKQRRALGAGYLDEHLVAGLWGMMNVTVSFAIPYHPQSKGVLERWFDTVDEQFSKTVKTWAGKRAEDKPDDLKDKLNNPAIIADAYSLDEFNQLFARYVETYNSSIHTGWGMNQTPCQVFATRQSRRILPDGVTDLLMRPWSPELTVGKNGISFKGLTFGQYDMDLHMHFGKKVRVTYDPADMSRVYVYDAVTVKLICIADQARQIAYGTGIAEEELRGASAAKSRARKIMKQFKDASLTANMDTTDIAMRAREQFAEENKQPISAVQALRPVITPLNGQVREHERQDAIKRVRRAAGGESITHVLDIDLSVLQPQKREQVKLFDE